jgi:hypothetical protein
VASKSLAFGAVLALSMTLRVIPMTAQQDAAQPNAAKSAAPGLQQHGNAESATSSPSQKTDKSEPRTTIIQNQVTPAPNQNGAKSDATENPGNPKWTATEWSAVIQAASAACIVGLTFALVAYSHRAWRVAKEAAEAAKLSADAAWAGQRAYLKVAPTRISEWPNWPSVEPTVHVLVENRGQTPARVTDVAVVLHLNEPASLPADPNKVLTHSPFARPDNYLLPGDSFGVVNELGRFKDDGWHRWRYGKGLKMWLVAYADYIDISGVRRRRGAAYVMNTFNQPAFEHESKPGYNYDREREKGEGRDWEPTEPSPP